MGKIEEYGGKIIKTDGRRTVEMVDPNDNAKCRHQYRAVPGGIERRVLTRTGKPFRDSGSPWEHVDLRTMLRIRGSYHPIIDELSADVIRMTRKDRAWSIEQMSDYLGISPRTVEGWEQGRTVPSHIFLLL